MDKYLYVVVPKDNAKDVKASFDNYLKVPNSANLIRLLYNSLALSLNKTPILKIEMAIDKIPHTALFKDGRITFSEKLIKQAGDINVLPVGLDSAFHELSHALMQINNVQIMQTKTCTDSYKPVFDIKLITDILIEMSEDDEFARGGALYYYNKNINEFTARKTAHMMCEKYLDRFAEGHKFNVQTFEEAENKLAMDLFAQYPFLAHDVERVKELITEYQMQLLKKGINNLSEQEIDKLIASINFHLSPETQVLLVIECARCNNIEKANTLLSTPIIKISTDEFNILCGAYNDLVLEHILYFKDDVQLKLGK